MIFTRNSRKSLVIYTTSHKYNRRIIHSPYAPDRDFLPKERRDDVACGASAALLSMTLRKVSNSIIFWRNTL